MDNHCVCCGKIIPEGRQVCPICEKGDHFRDTKKMVELKPCPFCGGEAAFVADTRIIKCKSCGGAFICTNPLISTLEVAEAWNRRADHGR